MAIHYPWSDASALWQIEFGAPDTAKHEDARAYLLARLDGRTPRELRREAYDNERSGSSCNCRGPGRGYLREPQVPEGAREAADAQAAHEDQTRPLWAVAGAPVCDNTWPSPGNDNEEENQS